MAEKLWSGISGQDFVAKRAHRDANGNIIDTTYATKDELSAAISSIPAAVQSDWEQVDDTAPDYIKNKPSSLTMSAGEGIGITEDGNTLVFSVSADYASSDDVDFLSGAIDNIPTPVQSDWEQSDNTALDYIKNKPSSLTMSAGAGIGITESGNTLVFSVSADYATAEDISELSDAIDDKVGQDEFNDTILDIDNDINFLSGAIDNIPAQVQSDWEETDITDPAYIQNKPDELSVSAGDYMNITENQDGGLVFDVKYAALSAQVAEDLVHISTYTIKV